MSECKRFPINGNNGTIPWGVAEQAYIEYCKQYGNSQTIETMAARGGFAISELDMFHPNWRPHEQALERIKELEGEKENLERQYNYCCIDRLKLEKALQKIYDEAWYWRINPFGCDDGDIFEELADIAKEALQKGEENKQDEEK